MVDGYYYGDGGLVFVSYYVDVYFVFVDMFFEVDWWYVEWIDGCGCEVDYEGVFGVDFVVGVSMYVGIGGVEDDLYVVGLYVGCIDFGLGLLENESVCELKVLIGCVMFLYFFKVCYCRFWEGKDLVIN